jgi:hypothetical protein
MTIFDKGLALEQEKFAKELRRWLAKLCLGIVIVVIVVLYFVFKK